MDTCTRCGAQLTAGNQFCAACGQPVTAPPTATQPAYAAPPSPPGLPPGYGPPPGPPPGYGPPPGPPPGYGPPPQHAPATGSGVNVDLSWLYRGNWVGALCTALVALVIALAASTALIFWSNPPHTSTGDKLTIAVMTTAATVSADGVGDLSFDLQDEEVAGEGSVRAVPLFITLLSLSGAAFAFRRFTRRYERVGPAIGDAARAAAIFALGLWLLALTVRGGTGRLTEAMDLDADDVSDASWGASPAGALFLGFTVLFVVLVLSLLARSGWSSPRWSRVSSIVAAPLLGFALLVAVLPVAGVVSYAAVVFTAEQDPIDEMEDDGGDGADVAAFLTSSVSNWGMQYLTLGAGGRVGYATDSSDFDEPASSEWHRLPSSADEMDDAWGLWLAVPLLALVLVGSTLVVALRARSRGNALPGLALWVAGLFLLVPLLSRLASVSGSMEISADGENYGADGYAGIKGYDSLLIPLLALLVTFVIGLLTGAIDLKRIRSLQATPDERPMPPPAQPDGSPAGWQGQAWTPPPSPPRE